MNDLLLKKRGHAFVHHPVRNVCATFKVDRLKVVSATFLIVCFVCLTESTCETRKSAFYFTLKALLVLEIIKL